GEGRLGGRGRGRKGRKGAGEVKRSRKRTRFHFAATALRIEKKKAVEELDFACGTDAAIKILEIGAAAEGDVLAIVNVLAVGQDVRRCAAAKEGTLLEQTNAPAEFSKRAAGCQSRQPAADHDHVFQECSLPCDSRNGPWP